MNHAEEVVEVVGHAAGESAYRFHLLYLLELQLEAALFRDVTRVDDDSVDRRVVHQITRGHDDGAPAPVVVTAPELERHRRAALLEQLRKLELNRGHVFRMHETEDRVARHVVRLEP